RTDRSAPGDPHDCRDSLVDGVIDAGVMPLYRPFGALQLGAVLPSVIHRPTKTSSRSSATGREAEEVFVAIAILRCWMALPGLTAPVVPRLNNCSALGNPIRRSRPVRS